MHPAFLLLHRVVACHLCLDLKGSNQAFKSPGQICKLLHPGYNINHTATMNTTLLIILDYIQSFLKTENKKRSCVSIQRDAATLANRKRLLLMLPVC